MYGPKPSINRNVMAISNRVSHRKVRLYFMKFGIDDYVSIALTGSKKAPKFKCRDRKYGTRKARYV